MTDPMYDELVRGLLAILSEQAMRITLYGSTARHTQTPESDVDIALFVNAKPTRFQEDQMSDLIVNLNLKYDKVISLIDIDENTYRQWREIAPFYRNVEREGVVLWKAA